MQIGLLNKNDIKNDTYCTKYFISYSCKVDVNKKRFMPKLDALKLIFGSNFCVCDLGLCGKGCLFSHDSFIFFINNRWEIVFMFLYVGVGDIN